MDIWDKKKRSAVMAKIRSKDTKPELIVRRYLWSRGYRYRKNVRGLPGTPDIVLRKYRVVIFVHGCFWHGHEAHKRIPSTRHDYWEKLGEENLPEQGARRARQGGPAPHGLERADGLGMPAEALRACANISGGGVLD